MARTRVRWKIFFLGIFFFKKQNEHAVVCLKDNIIMKKIRTPCLDPLE